MTPFRQLISILILLSIFSCRGPVPYILKKEFTCYTGQHTGLDTLINIHGYYTKMIIDDFTGMSGVKDGKYVSLGIDTSYSCVVFFSDGLFVSGPVISGPPHESPTAGDHLNKAGVEGGHVFSRTAGIYTIVGDTIKVKTIYLASANGDWWGDEFWYKIIDKNTIGIVYERHLPGRKKDVEKEFHKLRAFPPSDVSRFVEVANMPKSYNWLKDEKWFYCNEQ